MHAVLAPGLGNRFQLDIRRFSVELLIMFLNRPHLDEIQKQVFFFAKSDKSIIVKVTYGPFNNLQFVWFQMRARGLGLVADNAIFYTIVR